MIKDILLRNQKRTKSSGEIILNNLTRLLKNINQNIIHVNGSSISATWKAMLIQDVLDMELIPINSGLKLIEM